MKNEMKYEVTLQNNDKIGTITLWYHNKKDALKVISNLLGKETNKAQITMLDLKESD
jgi:hypothetical protein